MTATVLLDELRTKDVHLTVSGEHITLDAPKGVLTDAMRQAIREHKAVLLVLLSQPMPAAAAVQPPAPSQPAPLTPHYPCIVCRSTNRWDDRGIWRCVACWPPESLEKQATPHTFPNPERNA